MTTDKKAAAEEAAPEETQSEEAREEEARSAEAPGEELPEAEEVVEAEEAPSGEALKKLEEEKAQIYDQLLRLKAEFENFRKRADRDKPALIAHGKQEIVEKLIPLYDVLLTAHRHVQAHDEKVSAADLAKGLEMIFKEFTKLFDAEGIKVIEAVGKPYDFNQHEALGQVETDEHEDGTVVEELQRGYMLGERVLRAAKVRVAKKK